MPTKIFPTRANIFRIADALARERGGAAGVTLADIEGRVTASSATLRHFEDWRLDSAAAQTPELAEAIAALKADFARTGKVPTAQSEPEPPAKPARGRPSKAEEAATARGFLSRIGPPRRAASTRSRPDTFPVPADAGPAARKLFEALSGDGPPLAPARVNVRRADWASAANKEFAHAVCIEMRDRGHPLRTQQICELLARKFGWNPPKPDAALRTALKGSVLQAKHALWWFAGEERPRRTEGAERHRALRKMYVEAAMEVLKYAARDVAAVWVETRLGDAKRHFNHGMLSKYLVRTAAQSGGHVERTGPQTFRWRD